MAKLTTTLIIGTALIAVAGCSKKRPEMLPPAPSETAAPVEQPTTPTGPTTTGVAPGSAADFQQSRSEEHTSVLQSLMRSSSGVFCLKIQTFLQDSSVRITAISIRLFYTVPYL